MLIEKEVIRPGTYWYVDEATGSPRKLEVTPELTRYWHEQGSAMLSAGLPIPVPYEHDFDAHPMSPKEKLLNNAGEVKKYSLKEVEGKDGKKVKDVLFSSVEISDPDVKRKIGRSIRWTSPWINSFTDGAGKQWKNVISHLALTTRPRITEQKPFDSVAAALSMAVAVGTGDGSSDPGGPGYCLSRAGLLFEGKVSKQHRPRYPIAFSLWGGVSLADGGLPPPADDMADDAPPDLDLDGADPLADAGGDLKMEEILCHLLQALGVPMPDASSEGDFKRHLYEAAMSKIKELTSKGMGKDDDPGKQPPDQNKPPSQQPNASQPNPLISQVQQEQQPMYMSLEEINKLPDPMRGVALAMYNENEKLRAEVAASKKITDSLRDAKLREADGQRQQRVALLGKLSPRVKSDLDTMIANPAFALSMGEGGSIVDPMAQTLQVLEKGLADLPHLLTTEATSLVVQPQPTDSGMLDEARMDAIADEMARQMGCPPQKRAS